MTFDHRLQVQGSSIADFCRIKVRQYQSVSKFSLQVMKKEALLVAADMLGLEAFQLEQYLLTVPRAPLKGVCMNPMLAGKVHP